ncbi:hypothetical protein AB0O90_04990 [Microbacterium testaceum]|uniref:hypothetical protein n=1 Tax=Microbacterium testaceum TaxID=2033 RepID=UPI0034169565
MHHPRSSRPPRRRRALLAVLALVATATALFAAPATAADRGTGFGTWAPLSSTGWHGSMRVGAVHTYCIHPGLPVATGTTIDLGVSSDVRGLSPQQLVSINHLVSTYGQTDDPVQAASVGWAVKAIVDRDTTLHSWGYSGDSLSEAIDYIMRRASPENSAAIQTRVEQYLTEAAAVRVPRVGGSLTLTTAADEPTEGTIVADVDPDASGVLRLENAVFADTGSAERNDVRAGVVYPISAPRPEGSDGRPYTVRASGTFTVRAAAVRLYSTPSQQESAGPADPQTFALATEDTSARPVQFRPRIETSARIENDRFIDDVTVSVDDGVWPRVADGSFVPLSATADLYRTGAFPAESDEVPSNLSPVARLTLATDPARGPGTYRVELADRLPGPGVYTAVWRISRDDQNPAVAPHLPRGYAWAERFASPSQTEQLAPTPPSHTPTPTVAPTTSPVPSASPAPTALAATGVSSASAGGAAVGGIIAIVLGTGAAIVARRRPTRHP